MPAPGRSRARSRGRRPLAAAGLLAFVFPLATPVRAAEDAATPRTAPLTTPSPGAKPYGWQQIGHDARYLARRVVHPTPRGRTARYVVAGSAVLLYIARDEIREAVQDHRSAGRTRFLDDARVMGKGAFAPSLALVSYAASFATGRDREKETALLLLESAAYSAVTSYGGSFVLAAERPEDGDSIRFFDTDGRGVSLDTALAASVIPPLQCQYLRILPEDGRARRFWKRSLTALLYTGAGLTAFQRMDDDKHWAPDVFLGMAAGIGVGRTLCDAHHESSTARMKVKLEPLASGGSGVTFRWSL